MFVWKRLTGCWGDQTANVQKPIVRAPHTTSVRGNLVRTYRIDINEDYFVDTDQELGKGGCGVVVVGEHKETRTQYAIKIVDKAHAERGRLDRELKLLKDVDHTNVVRLFSVYDVPSHMYFVMELCTGGHLGNLLARQPKKYLDETWAKQLALQLFSAVAHIHSRGIAHRDIKLQNILVDQNNDRIAQLKLIDFGYGSRYVGALPMRTKCGTPYTTAPEVIREHYDERCDVWSCGVVLYIMLCGRRPFEALNITGSLADAGKAAMITNILAGRYHFNHKPWQTVSKQGLLFVKSLLHPDFRQRMHSHEALENPWLVDTAIASAHQMVLVSEKSFRAVENMRRMSDVSELQRTGMVALVFGINGKVTSDMSALFQSFDTDSSGMLSLEEFSTAMHKLAPELMPEDMEKLFHIIDYDKNNLISYTEFLAATIDPRDVDIGELNKAFRVFDEDGNGYISKEEMRKIIKSQCEQAQANEGFDLKSINSDALDAEVDAKVNKIFSEADVNNDGAISHAEFLWVMTGLDFHLLDRLGVPVSMHQGGFSAKDSYLYNSKLNNSHDSMEWEKDPRFDEEMGFSPRSMQSQGSTNLLMKQSFRGMPPRGPSEVVSGNNTIVASTSYNSNFPPTNSARPLGARSGSFHGPNANYPPLSTPVNSPHAYGWPNGPLMTGLSARLDTFIEKNVNSSSAGAESESAASPSERPVDRSGKRSPVPAHKANTAEKKDSPTQSGKLSPRTIQGDTNAEFLNAGSDDASGQLRTSPMRQISNQGNLAFYQEQPMIDGLRRSADEVEDDVEMGTVIIPSNSNPTSHPSSRPTSEKLVPSLVMPRPTSTIIMPGGVSARSGQKTNSVKFELQPMVSQNTVSTASLASTNIYQRDEEEKDFMANRTSTKENRAIGAMVSFSRQPSYRESTIIDASSGKDTIRVLSAKQQFFEEQQPEQQLSATSTRQNSGDVAVQYVQCVEKSDPIPPFLSRASSRVFSLSNMLRSPPQQHDRDLSHHNDNNSSRISGTNTSPLPVMMDMSPPLVMGSPGGYLAPLSRAASSKGAKLFGGEHNSGF